MHEDDAPDDETRGDTERGVSTEGRMEPGNTTTICEEPCRLYKLIICNGAPPGETPDFLRGDEQGRSTEAPRSFRFTTDNSACKVIRFECMESWRELIGRA